MSPVEARDGGYHLIRAQIRDDPLWDCEHGLASVGRGLD